MGPSKALGGVLTVYSHAIYILILKSTHVICVFVYIGNIHIFINVNIHIYIIYMYIYVHTLQLVKIKSSSTFVLYEEAIRVNNL